MTLVYADPETAPPQLGSPWPDEEGLRLRRAVRRAAAVPVGIGVVVQWLFAVAYALPETAGVPARSWWLAQLRPLAFVEGHRLSTAVLLIAAGLIFALARSGQRNRQLRLPVPAAVGLVTAALVGVQIGLDETPGRSALAVALLLVWAGAAGYTACYGVLIDLVTPPAVERHTGTLLLAAWVILLPGPLTLGRLLLASDLRAEAAVLSTNTAGLRLAALLTGASVRLYLFGAMAGVVLWLAYQGWPRRPGHRSWRWYAALVVAVLALTQLWWTAQTSAARRVTELQLGTPAKELRPDCATWIQPPAPGTPARTPTLTVSIGGRTCTTVTTFSGYHQLNSTVTGVRLSPVALRAPEIDDPAAGRVSVPLRGARYGGVLVLATTTRADRAADGLIGLPLRGGPPRWRFSCVDHTDLAARFPGGQRSSGPIEPLTGELEPVVLVSCGDQGLRLDPRTGLSR